MRTFWRLLEDSVIVQSLITLLVILGDLYLALVGQPVPDWLVQATMLILGFWFGTKMNQSVKRSVKEVIEAMQRGQQNYRG